MGLGDNVETIYRKLMKIITSSSSDTLGVEFNKYYDQTIEFCKKGSYNEFETAGRNALACLSEIKVDYKNKKNVKKIENILYVLTIARCPPPPPCLNFPLNKEDLFKARKEAQKEYCLRLLKDYNLPVDSFKKDFYSRIDRTF